PVNRVVASIRSSLESVADVNPTFMNVGDKAFALRSLVEAETRLVELRLRVLAASDDVADAEGFRSAGAWLSHHTRMRRSDAASDLALALALDRDRLVSAAAVRAGRVNVAQAKVIVTALEEIPTRVGPQVIDRAEAHLIELAVEHDPT